MQFSKGALPNRTIAHGNQRIEPSSRLIQSLGNKLGTDSGFKVFPCSQMDNDTARGVDQESNQQSITSDTLPYGRRTSGI